MSASPVADVCAYLPNSKCFNCAPMQISCATIGKAIHGALGSSKQRTERTMGRSRAFVNRLHEGTSTTRLHRHTCCADSGRVVSLTPLHCMKHATLMAWQPTGHTHTFCWRPGDERTDGRSGGNSWHGCGITKTSPTNKTQIYMGAMQCRDRQHTTLLLRVLAP